MNKGKKDLAEELGKLRAQEAAGNRDYRDFSHCVEKIKLMAGISGNKTKSIREAIRDDSFQDTIREAAHCTLMDRWPLREQQIFLEGLSGLSQAEKRIRIYETAYGLHRLNKLMAWPTDERAAAL